MSSIGSARLNVAQQAQQQRSQQAAAGNRRAALVALEFEVDMIEMHAPQSAAAGAHPLAQMLAAKRLSLELQPLQEGHPSLAGVYTLEYSILYCTPCKGDLEVPPALLYHWRPGEFSSA